MYLKTDGSDGSNNLSTKNINDVLGTPDQKDRRKSTPRTPKSPFVVQQTVKILVAEMMLQLLTPLKDRHALKSLRLGELFSISDSLCTTILLFFIKIIHHFEENI